MKFEVERAREWFRRGLPLIEKVDASLGRRSRTLQPRWPGNSQRHRAPALRRARPSPCDLQAAQTGAGGARCAGKVVAKIMSAGTQPVLAPWSPAPAQLTMAYSVCRGITRANAKNFYYAFLVLPKRKRQALCAVYAFMRRCDDIADDPTLSFEERRQKLDTWLDALHRVQQGQPSDDPILLALNDAQRRYTIPAGLLDELAMGTAMDVVDLAADSPGMSSLRRMLQRRSSPFSTKPSKISSFIATASPRSWV